MPLPLDDKSNPLYGLLIEEQCQTLIQWRKQGLTPYQSLSLSLQYTTKVNSIKRIVS